MPLRAERLAELRALGMEVKDAVERAVDVAHPDELRLRGVYGTIFTGPPEHEGADLRNVTIFADAQVDRSPCGTGTAAVMAVLDALGLLGADRPFVHESLIGTCFRGTLDSRTAVGELPAIRARIEGSAWITGEPHVPDRRRRPAARRLPARGLRAVACRLDAKLRSGRTETARRRANAAGNGASACINPSVRSTSCRSGRAPSSTASRASNAWGAASWRWGCCPARGSRWSAAPRWAIRSRSGSAATC